MSLWSNSDANTSAPKYAVAGGLGLSANGFTLYGNTRADEYITDAAIGVFGVDTTEQGVAANPKGGHAGWVLLKQGTGGIVTLSANANSYSPDGNLFLTFSGGGQANTTANARIVTNGAKKILSITVNEGGNYITTPTIAQPVNSNVSITVTMGGRANRKHVETLVAMGSMTGDGADDSTFADS